jgi:hypothetical protein
LCGGVLAEPLEMHAAVATAGAEGMRACTRGNAGPVDCPATGTGAGAIVCTCRAV